MSSRTPHPNETQDGLGKDFSDWRSEARPHFALMLELDRFDAKEKVSALRRPVWNKAKAIIEGRARWPDGLLAWKFLRERAHFHTGKRGLPAWENPRYWTPPQRIARRASEAVWARREAEIIADGWPWNPYAAARRILEAPIYFGGYGMDRVSNADLTETFGRLRREQLWKERVLS